MAFMAWGGSPIQPPAPSRVTLNTGQVARALARWVLKTQVLPEQLCNEIFYLSFTKCYQNIAEFAPRVVTVIPVIPALFLTKTLSYWFAFNILKKREKKKKKVIKKSKRNL